jgi:ribonuclease HI
MAPVLRTLGRSGCAGRAEFPDHLNRQEELFFNLGYVAGTNNRMEVIACIHALEWVDESPPWTDVTRVQIITDSPYVKNGVFCARRCERRYERPADQEPCHEVFTHKHSHKWLASGSETVS